MFLSANALPAGETLRADVCVVGTGPAGLSLACELDAAGLTVAALEAGGMKHDRQEQEFYKGDLVDPLVHPWLHHFRERRFGGTSTIWGGRCTPLDPIDFERRAWVPLSGWPISREALNPFYAQAARYLEIGRCDFGFQSISADAGATIPGFSSTDILTHQIERFSRPTDFGKLLRERIVASKGLRVVLNAPAVAVRLSADGIVKEILCRTRGGTADLHVHARHYVLALGGLETTRLMLASNDVMPAGIGNDSGMLGRCYMTHLAGTFGAARFAPAHIPIFDYERDADGVYCRRRLTVSAQAQRRLGIMNTIFRFHLPDITLPAHRDPVLSAMYLVKDLVLYEYSRKQRQQPATLRQLAAHVGNVVRGWPELVAFAPHWILRRNLSARKLPSLVRPGRNGTHSIEFHAEQAPNTESRVILGEECDARGMPRLRVDWRICDRDVASVRAAYTLLRSELARTGVAELAYDQARIDREIVKDGAYGGHHLGTARMSDDPRKGVVDADCRVHGVKNFHIASGAVFPTSSQANPTMTIVALALRLASHIARVEAASAIPRVRAASPISASAED